MSKNKFPVWDLSEYYNGIDDPKIEKDLEAYAKLALDFNKKYKGRVSKLDKDEFIKAFKVLEKLRNIASKLGGYAHLNSTTDMLNDKATALYQKVEERISEAATNLVFWSIEYNKLSCKKQDELIKALPLYAPYLKRVKKYKKLPLLAWPVPSQQDYMKVAKHCDNIIFEYFDPKI